MRHAINVSIEMRTVTLIAGNMKPLGNIEKRFMTKQRLE